MQEIKRMQKRKMRWTKSDRETQCDRFRSCGANLRGWEEDERKLARGIRHRFLKEIIDKLQKIKWWNWLEEKILSLLSELKDARRFVDTFSEDVKEDDEDADLTASMKELQSQGYTICYCIADFDVQDRVWQRVFENYLKAYRSADKTALLFGVRQGPETVAALWEECQPRRKHSSDDGMESVKDLFRREKMSHKTSIIILSYNTLYLLQLCIKSIR